MIEELQDMPAGVTGIRVSGRVSGEDLTAFKPIMDRLLDSDEIRFVEGSARLRGLRPGGLFADIKQGFSNLKHLGAFKRTAVVTDKDWIAHTMHALAWMIPVRPRCSAWTSWSRPSSGRRADHRIRGSGTRSPTSPFASRSTVPARPRAAASGPAPGSR